MIDDVEKPSLRADLGAAIVGAIEEVLGPVKADLHAPVFAGNEWTYLKDCLDSTFVSSVGAYVDRFERDLATFTGSAHAVAVVNGTAALHVALLLAGVERGDEVLVPALTFAATANAVSYCGAVPHFVDSSDDTLGVDPEALDSWLSFKTEQVRGLCVNRDTGRVIRAVVPMHTFGHPCDMGGLLRVARKHSLQIVEDAAESLGSYYHGRHTGTFGLIGTLSFNGNKTLTTGGGGAILTNDEQLARRAKFITTTAKRPHKWEYVHDEVGFNYRLPNLNAALGCAQLEQLPGFLKAKRELHEKYRQVFTRLDGVELVHEPENCRSNYWLQALKLKEVDLQLRDSTLEQTNVAGYMTRPVWKLMHGLQQFGACPRAPLDVAEKLEKTLINIPSGAGLV
ncbi:LegC family aminotransferase [Rhizobium leguminosarum]|uniref:LegC family aminotransferase n=1 Tax=Rhizobium leguminosarum TaxID=384 RepID=UPI001031AB55|nr:LegC family aminotransferase [Rhizobium leguminosarum]TAU87491.1 LegC family aminotransferase [Rhizobium leguminosarum]TAV52023.1 LegC family aminotransferase [Rhizobium leguminosarum]